MLTVVGGLFGDIKSHMHILQSSMMVGVCVFVCLAGLILLAELLQWWQARNRRKDIEDRLAILENKGLDDRLAKILAILEEQKQTLVTSQESKSQLRA